MTTNGVDGWPVNPAGLVSAITNVSVFEDLIVPTTFDLAANLFCDLNVGIIKGETPPGLLLVAVANWNYKLTINSRAL
jgi:hypothetical protein